MKTIEEVLQHKNIKPFDVGPAYITGDITISGVRCTLVATWPDQHVSIAPYNKSIVPTWDMMCKLKDTFFRDDEEAYEIHPKKSEYVNLSKNCLHLWGQLEVR